jgi:hypothetical protein
MSNPTWYKKDFNFINSEKNLELVDAYGFKGFFVYEYFLALLGQQGLYKLPFKSMKFNMLVKNIAMFGSIEAKEVKEIIDFCLSKEIFILDGEELVCLDIKNSFDDIEKNLEKRKKNGQKGGLIAAEKRKKLAEEKAKEDDKPTWKENAFNNKKLVKIEIKTDDSIDELEGDFSNVPDEFKGDFDTEGKQEKPPLVIKEFDNPEGKERLEKDVLDFYQITTELFNKNTEPHALKNKLEKEACTRLVKMIRQGIFRYVNLPDHDPVLELKKSIGIILNSKTNPSFYLTALCNQEIGEILMVKNNDPVDFAERIYKDIYPEMDLSLIE